MYLARTVRRRGCLCELCGFSLRALRFKVLNRKVRQENLAKDPNKTGFHRVLRFALLAATTLPFLAFFAFADSQPSIEELKAKIANAGIADRPALCIQLSEQQLGAADRLYSMGDSQQAKVALTDVVAFSELARDYSIQSHKHEKQSEIAIRKMVHRLKDLKHLVVHEDQEQIQNTIDRLQSIRDDLLAAMFPKAGKK
jgi:hypothetical protein